MPRHSSIAPTHPGELLREEVVNAVDITKVELARRLGVSRQHLDRLLKEQVPVTHQIAARLGKLAGNGPGIWLRLQADYDTWLAEQVDVSEIETVS